MTQYKVVGRLFPVAVERTDNGSSVAAGRAFVRGAVVCWLRIMLGALSVAEGFQPVDVGCRPLFADQFGVVLGGDGVRGICGSVKQIGAGTVALCSGVSSFLGELAGYVGIVYREAVGSAA